MDEVDAVCPVCKTDRYLNPKLELLVSPCYHKMCESCVSRIYATGSAPCPICRMTLRKTNFTKPIFESVFVEKECQIRKRLAKIFNKRLEDFGDSDAYNNYLEEVEDIVFNLVNERDVQDMYAQIEQYREANMSSIKKNLEMESREKNAVESLIMEETNEFEKRKLRFIENLQSKERERLENKRRLVEHMVVSDEPAEAFPKIWASQDSQSSYVPAERVSVAQKLSKLHRDPPYKMGLLKAENKRKLLYKYILVRLKDKYYDPATQPFEIDKHRAGGFSCNFTHKKAIEASSYGLFTQ